MGLIKKTVGSVPVPGEATVTLPAGRVNLNYDEARKGRSVSDDASKKQQWPGVPAGLTVSVRPAGGGDELAIDHGEGSSEYATFKRIGSRVGRVKIPADGEYTVTVAPFTTQRELFEPRIDLKA